jgi:YggT family protein
MLASILYIVLSAIYWVLVPAALLRFYMQLVRAPFRNPVGRFVCAVTDWIILPLRRVFRGAGYDWASLIAAYALVLALPLLMDVLLLRFSIMRSAAGIVLWLVGGVFGLAEAAIWVVFGALLLYAVLSWTAQGASPVGEVLERLVGPWLRPIRRRMPPVGGFDLSPLVLCVLLQIALVVLGYAQVAVLHAI